MEFTWFSFGQCKILAFILGMRELYLEDWFAPTDFHRWSLAVVKKSFLVVWKARENIPSLEMASTFQRSFVNLLFFGASINHEQGKYWMFFSARWPRWHSRESNSMINWSIQNVNIIVTVRKEGWSISLFPCQKNNWIQIFESWLEIVYRSWNCALINCHES